MQNLKKKLKYSLVIGCSLLFLNCIEPFEPEAVNFNSALVVEATITDENKNQEIFVSRTFALDTTGIYGERGAEVSVTDTNGAVYNFMEVEEGKYVSNVSFAAKVGLGYTLSIITNDGSTYSSDEVIAPQPAKIDSLYAERDFKGGEDNEGMFIYVDSYDRTGVNSYYRYTYEETYKIIVPYWGPKDYYLVDGEVQLLPRIIQNRICYNTIPSINILQTTVDNLSGSKLTKFPVRFLNRGDFKITYRYSINVRQFVQNKNSFDYYELLNKLNSSESLFSQIQHGFLVGNIVSDKDSTEKVVGYFQVSSVSSERLFFNYTDYFPNEPRPEFPADCYFSFELPTFYRGESVGLIFFEDYDPVLNPRDLLPNLGTNNLGTLLNVPRPCGDCTVFGSNLKPDFWVD